MHHIKLTKPFKLGKKTLEKGAICAFDRSTMNRLVIAESAVYCTKMGNAVTWDEDIAGPIPKKRIKKSNKLKSE